MSAASPPSGLTSPRASRLRQGLAGCSAPRTTRRDEAKTLRSTDPIRILGDALRAGGLLDEVAEADLRAAVTARIDAAYDFGRNSPYPAASEALQHVFAQ
ncbi:hypothetical protein [Cupriavidus sp. UYPR2.512]|uniref:hypothetical protein n=1 Tax=Cupriavidus sp. UYPR2.512 TaxID=1080187 RepID=UPI0003702A5B|nr:hypothetical protein [Cupriavidus sp. UYPR2.512]UIF87615.1 hypothetical protein KAF44_09190 [Cupriavidus necator]